nr:uncharacterized protein LOC127340068 [Lolium perenne]
MEAEEGSWLAISQAAGPPSAQLVVAADPQGVERPSQRVARRFRWLWLPKDCAIPTLGFPARASEVRQRLNDPTAPPHHLLRKIAPPPPLSRSFAAAVMDRGYEEGRKRRLEGEASQWRSDGGDFGEGRGSGVGRGDGGRQDGGGRHEGNSRQGGEYRYQGTDFRYQGRGRDDWGSPPPWWEEQQRREAAQRREEEQWQRQQEAQRGRGPGDRVATAGQGDRGGAGAPHQYNNNKARPFKKAQGAAGGAQQPVVKGKNKASASKGGTLVGGECFKCGREGHFQSECTFEPLCVICSAEGHTSANCPSRGKKLRLQSMGHAISGGGFYNIDVKPLRGSQAPGEVFAAIISFKGKPLSEEMLSDELKHLMDELWDWQVRKLSEVEFSVVFPSRETLRLSTGSGKLYLPLSKMDTAIREAFLAPKPSVLLPSTWVCLTGVPEDLMTKGRLMAAFVMVGRPFEVDELSLKKKDTEPIRMRFHCRFP